MINCAERRSYLQKNNSIKMLAFRLIEAKSMQKNSITTCCIGCQFGRTYKRNAQPILFYNPNDLIIIGRYTYMRIVHNCAGYIYRIVDKRLTSKKFNIFTRNTLTSPSGRNNN